MRVNEGRRVTHMRLAPSTVTGHYLQYSSVYDSFPFRVQASLQKKGLAFPTGGVQTDTVEVYRCSGRGSHCTDASGQKRL